MSSTFRINSPSVVAEIIDGEVIIMNLATGHYFSARGTGCELWDAIESGHSLDDACAALAAQYGVASDAIMPESRVFVESLLTHKLIVARDADLGVVRPIATARKAGAVFAAPELGVYVDMEELLLLDPIHDVDEERGWPMPRSEQAT